MTVKRTLVNTLNPLITPDGAVYANKPVMFRLVKPDTQPISLFDAVNGDFVVGDAVTVTTDENGEFSQDLWPNTRGGETTYYQVAMPESSTKPFLIRVTEAEGPMLLVEAKAAVLPTPTAPVISQFEALLASISEQLSTATTVVTTTVNGLMSYVDKVRLDTLWTQVSSLWSDVVVVRAADGLAAAVTAAGSNKKTIKFTVDQTLSGDLNITNAGIELVPLNGAKINYGSYAFNYPGSTAKWGATQVLNGTGVVTGINRAKPEWFGATGDGITDDSAAIQKAINCASVVQWDAKTYIADNIELKNNLTFEGAGKYATLVKRKTGSVNSLFYWNGAADNRLQGFAMRDMGLDGGNSAAGSGIDIYYFGRAYKPAGESVSQCVCTVDRCAITGFGYGAELQWGDQFYFNDCDIHDNGKGIYANNSANLVNITNCAIHRNTNEGVLIANVSSNCTVFGCYINDNGYGVRTYVAEQPSILYCAFNRNGLATNINAIYLEGYTNGVNTFITEAATIEGCLFGANAGTTYDIAMTYVEGVNLRNNYFYNITEGKLAFIRLFTHSKGVNISGSRWKAAPGVTMPPKLAAVAGSIYTLDDSGDSASPGITLYEPNGSSRMLPGVGVVSPTAVVAATAGALNCSAVKSSSVQVEIMAANITSIVFPASPVDEQRIRFRFRQATSGGPFTVAGWPADVRLAGGSFVKTATAGSQDVISFVYSAPAAQWLEVSRSMALAG